MTILFFSLLCPLAELYPNLYLSWFAPPNKNFKKYDNLSHIRLLAVILVWVPIIYTLSFLTSNNNISIITILIISAFGTKLIEKDIHKEKEMQLVAGMQKSMVTKTPCFTLKKQISCPKGIPEILYVIALCAIGISLLPHSIYINIISISLIFWGTSNISKRFINPNDDIMGRKIFSIGFVAFLYNLNQLTK